MLEVEEFTALRSSNQLFTKSSALIHPRDAQGRDVYLPKTSIISAVGRAKANEVWAYVVVITLVSILLYNIVGLIENYVLKRFSPQQWKER